MGTLGYQSHIDFLQEPEFMRADSNRRSFDATKSAMEFSGPVSSSLRKGGPALDDFEPILRDELGLLDFEDEFDSQRVMAVSPAHSEALASSLTMSSDAMLTMSPVSKAGPATVTSTLNIGQPASESEVSGFEELIEYDEPGVVSMGGGGQDLAAMSSVREPSASGDYHIPSSSSSSSRKDSVLSREVKSIAEVKLANSTGATYEEIQNESLHESPAEPVAIGAEPEGAIPNVALGNFDSSLGSPGQDTDLIEYVEEEDEEYDDEDDALNNSPVAHHSVKEPPETADLREADLKQEGEFEYAPLPCVLLDYRGDTHALFNLYPLNLDLKPIFDEEEYGGSLFASELTYFITELKTYFEIENDVSLECPELGVVIHEKMTCALELSVNRLYEFHLATLIQQGEAETSDRPLQFKLLEQAMSIDKRLAELATLAVETGVSSYAEEDHKGDTDGHQYDDYDAQEEHEYQDVHPAAEESNGTRHLTGTTLGYQAPSDFDSVSVEGISSTMPFISDHKLSPEQHDQRALSPVSHSSVPEKRAAEDSDHEGDVKRPRV